MLSHSPQPHSPFRRMFTMSSPLSIMRASHPCSVSTSPALTASSAVILAAPFLLTLVTATATSSSSHNDAIAAKVLLGPALTPPDRIFADLTLPERESLLI